MSHLHPHMLLILLLCKHLVLVQNKRTYMAVMSRPHPHMDVSTGQITAAIVNASMQALTRDSPCCAGWHHWHVGVTENAVMLLFSLVRSCCL
jgi:hypothetical protein